VPTLPSGLKLALLTDHIMKPDRNWFRAPEEHFWYWAPTEEFTPPFSEGEGWEGTPVTAPVPETREEMKNHVRVCIGTDDGMMY